MEQWSLHQGPGALAPMGLHLPLPPHLPWPASCVSLSPSLTPSTRGPFQPSPCHALPRTVIGSCHQNKPTGACSCCCPPPLLRDWMQAQAGLEGGATLPCAIFRESMEAPSPLQAGRVTVCVLDSLARPNPGTRHGVVLLWGGVVG